MKILNRKNMIEWHINGEKQLLELRRCAKRFENGEKTVDNRDNRLFGESFTNLFRIFDEDVETRNFMYVFRADRSGKMIVDEEYRKIKVYIGEKEWERLLSWNILQEAILELGEMCVEYAGEEQTRDISVNLINDEIYQNCECEEFYLTEELLSQIIVLEDK